MCWDFCRPNLHTIPKCVSLQTKTHTMQHDDVTERETCEWRRRHRRRHQMQLRQTEQPVYVHFVDWCEWSTDRSRWLRARHRAPPVLWEQWRQWTSSPTANAAMPLSPATVNVNIFIVRGNVQPDERPLGRRRRPRSKLPSQFSHFVEHKAQLVLPQRNSASAMNVFLGC